MGKSAGATEKPAAPAAAGGTKKPDEAKGFPAPKPTPEVKKVPVQCYAARLFARHVVPTRGSFDFIGPAITISADAKIDLTYAVPEAAVFVKIFLADKDFVVVKTTTGKGRKAKSSETLAKINGKVTLKVEEAAKYGFVVRTLAKGAKKPTETAPAGTIELDVTNGETKIGTAADGVILLRAIDAASTDPSTLPSAAPGPDTKITIEMGELKDEKKNAISKEQLGGEQIAAKSPVEWPVTSKNRVGPEVAHNLFPSSNEVAALQDQFKSNFEAFLTALKEITVGTGKLMPTVSLSSVFRSPQHAYLFCWSWRIAKGEKTEKDVLPYRDADGQPDSSFPDIDWRPSEAYASNHKFLKNITAFYNPPGSVTNHLLRMAVDCNMPVDISAKIDCKIKLPATFFKITRSTGADGKAIFAAAETKNTKAEESFSLEPNDGANGWVAVDSSENKVKLIKDKGDKKTYRAGNDSSTDFTIDVSGKALTAKEKADIKKKAEEELTAKGEESLQAAIDAKTAKRVAATEAERVKNEEKKRRSAKPKKPPLTPDEKDALKLNDAETKKIRDEVEKSLRPPHEKALKKQIEAEGNARVAAEEKSRKQAEHDKQFAVEAPKAEAKATEAAEGKRKKEGNYWKQLHLIGEKFFGVVHFRNVLKDLPHWSYNGG